MRDHDVTCTKCGRKFENPQALGGHISHAHLGEVLIQLPVEAASMSGAVVEMKQNGQGPAVTPTGQQPASEAAVEAKEGGEGSAAVATTAPSAELATEQLPQPSGPKEDESEAEQIRQRLAKGYTLDILVKQYGFNIRTVRQELDKFVPSPQAEGKAAETNHQEKAELLPVTRKMGGGVEVIAPEALLRQYMDGTNEDKIELRGMMKMRAAMLMVMDLIGMRQKDAEAFAAEIKPMIDLMKETRAEQDAAAQRAKESSAEVAQAAVDGTLQEILPVLKEGLLEVKATAQKALEAAEKRPAGANPMAEMMAPIMQLIINQATAACGMALPGGNQPQQGKVQVPGFTNVN